MTTLADYGVVSLDLVIEEEYPRDIRCELIKETEEWEEVVEIVQQNYKTHQSDKIWIRCPYGRFRVLREVV